MKSLYLTSSCTAYGVHRFGVTILRSLWLRLLSAAVNSSKKLAVVELRLVT